MATNMMPLVGDDCGKARLTLAIFEARTVWVENNCYLVGTWGVTHQSPVRRYTADVDIEFYTNIIDCQK